MELSLKKLSFTNFPLFSCRLSPFPPFRNPSSLFLYFEALGRLLFPPSPRFRSGTWLAPPGPPHCSFCRCPPTQIAAQFLEIPVFSIQLLLSLLDLPSSCWVSFHFLKESFLNTFFSSPPPYFLSIFSPLSFSSPACFSTAWWPSPS